MFGAFIVALLLLSCFASHSSSTALSHYAHAGPLLCAHVEEGRWGRGDDGKEEKDWEIHWSASNYASPLGRSLGKERPSVLLRLS